METLWFTATLVLATTLLGGVLTLRFLLWPLYAKTRDERDEFEARLVAVSKDRDGWRSAAERALLVAQIGRNTSKRVIAAIVPRDRVA